MDNNQYDKSHVLLQDSTRNIQIPKVRFARACGDHALHNLQFSTSAFRYHFEGKSYQMVAAAISDYWLLTVVHDSYASHLSTHLQSNSLTLGNRAMNISRLQLIDLKAIYPELNYILLAIEISQRISVVFGYNFTPLPYQQKRSQLMRTKPSERRPHKYSIYNAVHNQLVSDIQLYPFVNPQHNFILEHQNLPILLTGSPILQQIGRQLLLIGFYCENCEAPISNYHNILLFNEKIHKKLQQRMPKDKAEKMILNYRSGGFKIGSSQLARLSYSNFVNLVVLQLGSNRVGSKGVKLLVRSHFSGLTDLQLDGNNIDDATTKFFCKAQWPSMHSLSLVNNFVTGPQSLIKAKWRQLSFLNLYKNKFNSSTIRGLFISDSPILSTINLQKCEDFMLNVNNISLLFHEKFSLLQKLSL